jgi:hypothetical protein
MDRRPSAPPPSSDNPQKDTEMPVSQPSRQPLSSRVRRCVLGALGLCGVLPVLGAAADAATIYNFSFVQTGYVQGPADSSDDHATVSGTFSGTLNGGGYLEAANLTDFHLQINYEGNSGGDLINFGAPYLFSYIPGDNGSLNIVQGMNGGVLGGFWTCIGFAVSLVCDGTADLRGSEVLSNGQYFFSYLVTTTPPEVTLVSTVSDAPPVAPTPIPATLPLFMTALGGVGAYGAWRRKSAAAA